ncbi:hypothetical protein IFM89_006850 [Coptis chinensis]|uniref:Uncharacterized protein n=1 Tax=Coptis chinensis TaxID=261450 RepID=A0A835LR74_9MAGN|nr:hypothetical protein IFM89_006850 [Coptis chinensis]
MKHIDALGRWFWERHRRLTLNKLRGRYFGDKNLHRFIIYDEQIQDKYEHNRRLMNPVTIAIQQAIHGLSYTSFIAIRIVALDNPLLMDEAGLKSLEVF